MSADRVEAAEVEEELAAESREGTQLAGEDFYMDGQHLVFTAAYHVKRGFCCGSGCRHCPYGHAVSDSGE